MQIMKSYRDNNNNNKKIDIKYNIQIDIYIAFVLLFCPFLLLLSIVFINMRLTSSPYYWTPQRECILSLGEYVFCVCNTVILPVLLLLLLLFAIPRYLQTKSKYCMSYFLSSLSSSLAKSMLYKIMPFHTIFCTKLKKKSAIPYYTLYLRKYRTSSIINIRFCLRFFTLINIRIRKEFLVILRACSPGQNFEVFKYYTPEKWEVFKITRGW